MYAVESKELSGNINNTLKEEAYVTVEHYPFKIHSDFEPQGDQPQAIKEIVEGIKKRGKDINFIRCYWHRENIYDE